MVSGKNEEAEQCLKYIARKNGKQIGDTPIISETLIKSVKSDTENATNYSILDIFKHGPDLWKIALKESLIGAVVFLCYIGVHLNVQSLPGDVYVNHAIYGLVEIPADILAVIMMERKLLGRTRSVFVSLLICAVCYVILGVFTNLSGNSCQEPDAWISTATLIFAIISKMFVTSALCIIFTQAAELFPVEIRSIGWGLCSTSFDIGGCFAPFFLKLNDVYLGLPLFLMASFCFGSGFLALTLPETRGIPLLLTIKEAQEFYKNSRRRVCGGDNENEH